MFILKLLSLFAIFTDVLAYMVAKPKQIDNIAGSIGYIVGIAARCYVLYGTITCWLLS